ncbi:MAG: hypothetical protein D6714_11185 [Bacteroidetes bacterium]|nr:MAG: hypothetical protein D6714_11185 [Bacteroidota bacterium]
MGQIRRANVCGRKDNGISAFLFGGAKIAKKLFSPSARYEVGRRFFFGYSLRLKLDGVRGKSYFCHSTGSPPNKFPLEKYRKADCNLYFRHRAFYSAGAFILLTTAILKRPGTPEPAIFLNFYS